MTARKLMIMAFSALIATSVSYARDLNTEEIPENEAGAIKEATDLIRLGAQQQAAALREGKTDKVRRGAHGKHHGCLKANVQVLKDLPADLRQGVFAYGDKEAPPSYKAWIRMSNGAAQVQADWIPDGRGMAIKLFNVKGAKLLNDEKHTQDFVMINNPEFFVRHAKDYVEFMKDRANFFKTRKREFQVVSETAGKFITSPLEQKYFSMAPSSLGPKIIKFSAQPCEAKAPTLKWGDLDLTPVAQTLAAAAKDPTILGKKETIEALKAYEHYLTTTLSRHVGAGEVCYDFYVQFQKDAKKHDVEDATSDWRDSELHKVARITIEKQTIAEKRGDENFKEQDKFCEDLTLTPWHATEAHTPRGGIQRLRKEVYITSSELRHKFNGAELKEPTGDETFEVKKKDR